MCGRLEAKGRACRHDPFPQRIAMGAVAQPFFLKSGTADHSRASEGRPFSAAQAAGVRGLVAALVALCRLLLLTLQRTIRYLLIVDGLKIGSESLERLVVEHLAARYVLGAVVAVIAHVEPLHLEAR